MLGSNNNKRQSPTASTFLPSSIQPGPPREGKNSNLLYNSILYYMYIFADLEIAQLLEKETELMINRATVSARKHGIQLRHGRPNLGTVHLRLLFIIIMKGHATGTNIRCLSNGIEEFG